MSLTYTKTANIRGNPQKALDLAALLLARDSFEVKTRTHAHIEAVNTIGCHSNKQPLRGLSRVEVLIGPGTVTVTADMGALRKFFWLMSAFLASLSLVLTLTFSFVFHSWQKGLPGILPILPWIVILPLMRSGMVTMVRKELDVFLNNLVQAASG